MADSCWLLSATEFVHRETKKKNNKGEDKGKEGEEDDVTFRLGE